MINFNKLNYNSFPIKEKILSILMLLLILLILLIIPLKIPFYKKILNFSIIFDHKKIGKLYIYLSLIMLIRGFIDALMMRFQQILCFNHEGFLSNQHYCQIFTAHGVIMIFFVAMPFMIGLMNIIIPIQIGSKDVAFPSLNLLSFWLTFFSSIIINISLIFGEFAKTGWLAYPPLSEKMFSPWVGVDYWIWSIQISGISTIISSINFIITIIKCRKKFLFLFNLPIFIWTCLCSNLLILISFPILSALLIQLFLDRSKNSHFFSPFYGGNSMLYINLIWAWGHPEVYILILPSFGIFSEIISNVCEKSIFSYKSLIYATISITILSFIVWLHHFFTMGSGYLPNIFFSISTMIIAIPTGVKIFNWVFTLYYSNFKFNPNSFWFIIFIIIFSMGGFAGIILSIPTLDYIFHNTTFLIAHFHTVIIGGVLFGYLAGMQYWFPIIYNKKLINYISYINIFFWFVGVILSFFPLYILGYFGMMRRTNIYFNFFWNKILLLTFFGSIIILFSIILFFFNFFLSKNNRFNIYRNCEFLNLNNLIIENNNNFFYKKKFIFLKKIYIKHKKSKIPFYLSLILFFNIFFLIWCFNKLFNITFVFFILILIIYIYE
ncbi:cbb3-type cytochrome c oxidase subunit I [Candidatus Carsonella ruddii]|uniref:Cytochrome O ubiquinol oxidase subunit I n=1 Tax=Candidatus Carsonella ruddii CE isolate Thao2000 TaxID=1202536 RepID=J7GSE2_CARRU|nr:cbb3-type cytochrome c oxidase subunit I [Candidatus Carsonella ruddii]AFP83652.1 cytochrome O ubiquinol oxidase subunit I [Candidatus Carsonella ruddii CE isolate Thao2000]